MPPGVEKCAPLVVPRGVRAPCTSKRNGVCALLPAPATVAGVLGAVDELTGVNGVDAADSCRFLAGCDASSAAAPLSGSPPLAEAS